MKRVIAVILALTLALTLCACGKKAAGEGTESPGAGQETLTWQEQYDLGVRYLSEGDYEQAIIAFTAAIEIDPKRAEAYLGLSDAYTAAGDPDAARKALEDGLAATDDPELQARLDAMAEEAGNLTGQPPFTLQDLEDWGYPYGIDAYTLEREGKIETGRVEEMLQAIRDWPGGYPDGGGTGIGGTGLIIYVENDMSLHSIVIDADSGDTAEGPRGLYLGMSAEDALNLFRCGNPDAVRYLQTGDESLLTEDGELRSMSLYDLYDDEANALTYSGKLYLRNRGHYKDGVLIDEERRVVLNYEIVEMVSLDIDITNGIVSEIEVRYWS